MLQRSFGPSRWVLVIPALMALSWVTLSGYQGLNGQDAHDYLRIARGWSAWCIGGPRPMMVEHPHGYPLAGALVGTPFGSELIGLRIVSFLAFVILLFAVRNVLQRVGSDHGHVDTYLMLAIGVSPFVLRYTLMVMSDVAGMALIMVAFACTVKWRMGSEWGWGGMAFIFALSALVVRLAVAPMVVALVVALIHGERPGRAVRWSIVMLVGAVLLALIWAMLPSADTDMYLDRTPLAEWSPLNLFKRTLFSDDGELHYRVPNLLYVLGVFVHPGMLPIGVFLLPFVRWSDQRNTIVRMSAFVLVGYLLFIGGMPFQNDRVLLMALPFVVILLFPACTRAMEFARQRNVQIRSMVVVALLLQAALFVRAMLPNISQAHTERELAAKVNTLAPSHIYTHGMGAALANYCAPVEVIELWYTELDTFWQDAIVVVHPSDLEKQWQGRAPFINWQRLQRHGLVRIEDHPEGWTIQRIP